MGAFFTNVQVHTAALDPDEARTRIVAVLREWAASQGMYELTDDDRLLGRAAQRTILVGPPASGRWLGVFDELTEDQRHEHLIELTQRLSRVGGSAVGVLNQHSDLLSVWLARDGAIVDEYRSQQQPGDAERWRDLLDEGATVDQLQQAFERSTAFAEDKVFDLAPLLGWEAGLTAVGFNDLERGLNPTEPGAFTQLDFRSPTDPLADLRGSGPPIFTQGTSFPLLQVAVGEPISGFIAMFQNTGGPGTGLDVVVWGPGLDLLDLDGVKIGTQPGTEAQEFELIHSVATEDSTPLRYLELPDVAIPPGMARGHAPVPGMAMRRVMEAQFAACISVVLTGRGARAGSAELNIGVVPADNRAEGQTSWTLRVNVT